VQAPQVSSSPVRPPTAPRVFYRSFRDFLRDLSSSAQRFWLLVVATGLLSGLGAVLLVNLLRFVQGIVWNPGEVAHDAADATASPMARLIVCTAGGVLVTVVSLIMRRPLGGHGTSGVIEAIWFKAGHLPIGRSLVRGALSIILVGMGASLGREGALIQGGASTGSWLGERFRIGTDQVRLLVACGAAAGIAAAYNMPIGASLFGLEVFLGSFALELFGPVVVSCVIATLVSRVLIASHPTYEIPAYTLLEPRQLCVALVIGLCVGAASALFVKVVDVTARAAQRIPKGVIVFCPPFAMFALGMVARWYPQILGNGYSAVNAELLVGLPLGLLVILPFLKLAMTSLCAASGIPGGMYTPSLFYGALLGGALGEVAARVIPGGAGPPGAFAIVGMGAALAGTTQAVVSTTVMIFELTGNYGVVLPLMLAGVAAASVSRHLVSESLYTAPLRRRNVRLPDMPRPQWLSATPARALLAPEPPRIEPDARFAELLVRLLSLPRGQDLYVCAADGRLLGVVVLEAVKAHIVDEAYLGVVVAADVMEAVRPVHADASLSEVAVRFGETWMERLPVVDEDGHLLGTISKGDLLRRGRF
jgi:CIC family chloride channel protein